MRGLRAFLCVLPLLVLSFPAQASQEGAWTWDEVRWGGIVQQELDNSCGLAALLTIMRSHFGDERYDERLLLKKYIEVSSEAELLESMKNGLSLLDLENLAQSAGYATSKKVLTFDELERLVSFVPVLVYLEIGRFRHFAVVRGVNNGTVLLVDSSRGNIEYSRDEFLTEWKTPQGYPERTGVALIVVRREGVFAQKLLREPVIDDPQSFIEIKRWLSGRR